MYNTSGKSRGRQPEVNYTNLGLVCISIAVSKNLFFSSDKGAPGAQTSCNKLVETDTCGVIWYVITELFPNLPLYSTRSSWRVALDPGLALRTLGERVSKTRTVLSSVNFIELLPTTSGDHENQIKILAVHGVLHHTHPLPPWNPRDRWWW